MRLEHNVGSGMRTIALLKLVAEMGGTFTLGELSAKASLPPSSVHRLLQPLLRAGLVERAEGQAYCTGAEFLKLASLVMRQVDVGRLARPILRRLWTDWEETCTLCIYKPAGHNALVVETIQTKHPLRFVIEPFSELSLTWGSLGRAILSWLPPQEMAAAIRRPGLGPLTGLPTASLEELEVAIAETRANGFAQYRNEVVDLAGIAAPVFRGESDLVGSLGISAPAQRMHAELVPAMARAVVGAAQELSDLLGAAD